MTMHKSIFPVLVNLPEEYVPVFIPTFNQPSLLKVTLNQLESYNYGPVIIYDNNSTYSPMQDFLESISDNVDVVRSLKNSGPRIFTEDTQILNLMPKYFVVTDPDLIYNKELPNDFIPEMKKIIASFKIAKAGFALEINDPEEILRFQDAEKVDAWERPYWQEVVGQTSSKDPIYSAWIDTTFSLNNREACKYYRKFDRPTFRYPSVRIGGKYTCQHTGWWKKNLIPQPEEENNFYLKNQKWSHTENYYYK